MNFDINPFQELYVTDSPNPRAFVSLFSDYLIPYAQPLFLPGNVILKGTQGSGKSMLLNLFKPQIRLAYQKASAEFPIPKPQRNFIGAGINLTRSGVLDIGQRPLSKDKDKDEMLFPLYFADFINYYIVRDILNTLEIIKDNLPAFDHMIDPSKLDAFAVKLASQDCWFDCLTGCNTFESLREALDKRISTYRAFHQYNGELSVEIENTKTTIGEPIARTEVCLKEAGVIDSEVPVFVRVDQVERLYRSDILRPTLGQKYRQIINKALGTRDSRISYRIGTRRYAWEDNFTVYGTDDQLERLRDFRIIDLDELLRRKEDVKTWIFPGFAQDAFVRRLNHVGYKEIEELLNTKKSDPVRKVFGSTPSPDIQARSYSGNSNPERILKLDNKWPNNLKEFLLTLFAESPLSSVLAAAWCRQQLSKSKRNIEFALPKTTDAPWEKTYWKKERVRQCLLQIAARAVQRFKWCGKEQILALSAGNISIFLSICNEIWDAFLRAERRKPVPARKNPITDGIDHDIQAVAIMMASTYWYKKVSEQPKGDDRQRFIEYLGAEFRTWLIEDIAMSYPGWNGFSLANDELEANPELKRFLNDAVDYGDLYDVPHTTKNKDRRPRTKWYLNPILSAHFQIPENHVKEPYYATVEEVKVWLSQKGILVDGSIPVSSTKPKSNPPDQPTLPLFD